MIDAVKSLPKLIEEWKAGSNSLYQLLGCCAGWLALVAYFDGALPSEYVVRMLQATGAGAVARWLEAALPIPLVEGDSAMQHIFLRAAGLTVLLLLVKPFFKAGAVYDSVESRALRAVGSRCAYTTWILMMFAAQCGSIQWIKPWLQTKFDLALTAAVVPVAVIIALFLLFQRLGMRVWVEGLATLVMQVIGKVVLVGAAALGALAYVVLDPPCRFVSWLLDTEQESFHAIRLETARKLADMSQPTGAIR